MCAVKSINRSTKEAEKCDVICDLKRRKVWCDLYRSHKLGIPR